MADRKPRDMETRDLNTPRYEYVPPNTLPSPNPQDGWAFRWVALAVHGHSMPSNVSQRFREGWEPVRCEDVPELMLPANKQGNVEVGGLVLCKAPQEMVDARADYYRKQAASQMKSVNDQLMSNNDPRMPLFRDHSTEDSRGKGFGSGTK